MVHLMMDPGRAGRALAAAVRAHREHARRNLQAPRGVTRYASVRTRDPHSTRAVSFSFPHLTNESDFLGVRGVVRRLDPPYSEA